MAKKPQAARRTAAAPKPEDLSEDLAGAAGTMSEDDFPTPEDAGDDDTAGADGADGTNEPDPDPDPADVTDPDAVEVAEAGHDTAPPIPKTTKPAKKKGPFPPGMPHIPSFDLVDGEPNMRGEDVAVKGKTPGGIPFVQTTGGRRIFACKAAKYEKEFGKLVPRDLWMDHYPEAFTKADHEALAKSRSGK